MFVYTIPRLCIAFTASVVLIGQAHAATLIRCPDWQSLMPKSAVLRSTPTTDAAFDQAIRRATNQRSAKTRTASQTAAQITGPLDAAGIFSRDGRRDSNKRTAKYQITAPCPTHTVRKGDTLAKIAMIKLGTAKRYPELLAANAERLKDPNVLPIGTVLTLPCTAPTPLGRQGILCPRGCQTASLQGKPVAANTRAALAKPAKAPKATKTKPVVKAVAPKPAPPVKPLPVWRAKSGEYFTDVVKRWGKKAGYRVIISGTAAWQIKIPIKEVGTFEETLKRLVKGLGAQGQAPTVRIFANKVIKIGTVL